MSIVVAVDTGGTFTDVVLWDGERVRVLKLPSTPDHPDRAVLEGVRCILAARADSTAGAAPSFALVHGSTVATNALLERRGARVALVTNEGFEDVLELGRQNRPQLYALACERPAPLVPRDRRHGVHGRIGPAGEEIEPLNDEELTALAERMGDAESIAVCLLHSYAHPQHEDRVAGALSALGVPVSVSSRILPEFREYERTATTVVNAYIAPLMQEYLGSIETGSGARRVRIMGSGGGAFAVARARREPVHTVLSGPAGGVAGALEYARLAGIANILTFDMGGTSTDVSLCPGRPQHTREFTMAGLPIAVPVLDIHTVGAGGGSIATVDAGGALRVGPESAGAVPGPICYARGGTAVTVTDANVWLGRLPARAWAHDSDAKGLDRDAIASPIKALALAIGSDADGAAEGVLAVVNATMERALRVISVERGHDPASFTLVPFGGAAGLHVVALAERLRIPAILVPPDPGVLSAWGMLVAPVRKEAARTVLWNEHDAERFLAAAFKQLTAEAMASMEEEGVPVSAITMHHRIDARYRGQSFELTVPAENWTRAFHEAHLSRYGYDRPDAGIEAVTIRVEALAPGAPIEPVRLPRAGHNAEPTSHTTIRVRGEAMRGACFARSDLRADHRLEGPAIVLEYSSTFWLPAGWGAVVREDACLLVEPL
ncbi:MAG: hydantoinase/oxoprolinase family protein [Longimicrobiales bacterium]